MRRQREVHSIADELFKKQISRVNSYQFEPERECQDRSRPRRKANRMKRESEPSTWIEARSAATPVRRVKKRTFGIEPRSAVEASRASEATVAGY
jgi:hypothetical protein